MSVVYRKFAKRSAWICAVAVCALAAAQTGGCYYMQAVNGQLEVLRKREPIAEVIQDPAVANTTRERLSMVLDVRRFAVETLFLPDNDSYKTYTDLKRDYVVWNVFAAPEFSFEPKTWCFPVVGCVAYRGYFSEESANRHADKLKAQGYDVFVGGVPAYSTLGKFDDPLLNTMMRWSDADLVSTMFHELAHQRLFIKGDTGFNESFATAVAETGLRRWLSEQGREDELEGDQQRNEYRRALARLADAAKSELSALYEQPVDVETKRLRKQALLDALSSDAQREAARLGFDGAGWLRPPLNNARLVSTALYRGNLGAFRRMLQDCDNDMHCFYAEAERLAELSFEARQQSLADLIEAAERDAQGLISGK